MDKLVKSKAAGLGAAEQQMLDFEVAVRKHEAAWRDGDTNPAEDKAFHEAKRRFRNMIRSLVNLAEAN